MRFLSWYTLASAVLASALLSGCMSVQSPSPQATVPAATPTLPTPTSLPAPTPTPTEVPPQVLIGDFPLAPVEDVSTLEQEGFAPLGSLDLPSLTEAMQAFQQQIGAGVIRSPEDGQPTFYYLAEEQFAYLSWLPQQFRSEGKNLSLTESSKDIAVYTDEAGQRYVIGLSDSLPELDFQETKAIAGSIALSEKGLHTIYVTDRGEVLIRTHRPMRVEAGYTVGNLSLPPYRESPVMRNGHGEVAYIYNPVEGEWQAISEKGREVLRAIEQFLAIPEADFRAALRQMRLWRQEYEKIYGDYRPRDRSSSLKPLIDRRIGEPYLGFIERTNSTDKTTFYYKFSGALLGILPVQVDLTAFPEGYQVTSDTVNILVIGYELAPHQRGIMFVFLGEGEFEVNYKELHCDRVNGCRFGTMRDWWVRRVANVIKDLSDKPPGAPIIIEITSFIERDVERIPTNDTSRSLAKMGKTRGAQILAERVLEILDGNKTENRLAFPVAALLSDDIQNPFLVAGLPLLSIIIEVSASTPKSFLPAK